MKTRNFGKSDLEKKRFLFLQIGLLLALSVCFLAFEWKTYHFSIKELEGKFIAGKDPVQILPPVKFEKIKVVKPEQKKIEKKKSEKIKVVPDFTKIVIDSVFSETKPIDSLIKPVIIVPELIDETDPFIVAEIMPEFNGGYEAMRAYIQSKVKYPGRERSEGITGTVFLSFVIDKQGAVRDVKILKGVTPSMDAEAARVLLSMPAWKPGAQNGHKVSVIQSIDIRYKLQ